MDFRHSGILDNHLRSLCDRQVHWRFIKKEFLLVCRFNCHKCNFLAVGLQINLGIPGYTAILWKTKAVTIMPVSIIFIPAATYRFQKETVKNNRKYKDLDEERMKVIESRNKEVYGKYIRNILGIGISNYDLDTKIFFVAYFLQMILLFSSIISITHTGNFTSGLLFSTVTYVEMLNGYVSDINENLILLHDLKETITRLKEDYYNEL